MEFTPEQWTELMERYPPGTVVHGNVVHAAVFGVFVRLDELPEVTALLELIHFPQNEEQPRRPIEFPEDYPRPGTRISARILGWCLSPNRDVRLTQLSHLNWIPKDQVVARSDIEV